MAKERPARPSSSADSPASIPVSKAIAPVNGQKTAKRGPKGCSQLTVWIPDDLMFRLDQIARFQKTRKLSFVVKLLEQGCRQYKVDADLQSLFTKICLQLRESEKESAA
jgi:hypothetical protein